MASESGTVISFGLNDRPPVATAAFVGLQHLLAVFGGILTAPLLIALGMELSVRDTSYLVTSALVISGFATLVQVSRIGPVGSGMLSVQGTSFSFIGPLLYAYPTDRPPVAIAAFVGLQHLLAVFGGILTAPLLIALGMELSVRDTSYLVTSALVISGFATLVQVSRIGPVILG